MKTLFLIGLASVSLYANVDSVFVPPAMEQYSSMVLQVGDRDVSARKVIALAESLGGYFLAWDEWNINLRIPSPQLNTFLTTVESQEQVVEKGYSTTDQSSQIDNLQASIASRRKLLDSYFAMVQSSNSSSLQTVQRAIVSLISQIELDQGRLRGMQQRIQLASVQVSFRFQDRSLPAPTGSSPFPWINQLNLTTHRESFQ